jgi:hypothetical protein
MWLLLLWNLLKLRLWLGRLLLRGISLGNLLWILLSVTSSSFAVVSIVVRAGIGVIVALIVHLCQQLYNEAITIFDHLLLLIIVLVELLNLMHSLSQCMIHSHGQPHLLSQSSS